MKKPAPFGKYYLLERINVGGMAEVFRAKAFGVEGFERLVAVKRILPNIAEDKEFIRMFIEEAKLAVQLNHANIAQIYDLGVNDGSYYIALEHVHGRDLRAIFDRCRGASEPMPVSQACFIVMKVCEGLDYAHNKRDQAGRELHLVHRDVSPQNVLVSFEGEVKIIDFGIAKAAGKGSKTQAGILKGKFGYMSPEQVRGIPIDRRSDVFSCGIVLYELLTGERLFVGESDFSTLEKVRNVEILPPSTYNRRIPDELERIVLKALAKDPEDRYANAIDLHDELQAFVYTAGEFYSRKDLAGWMKKTFGREIEEESAKLESYRQLKAPVEPPRAPASGSRPPTTNATTTPVRKASSLGAIGPSGTKPPPPPTRMSAQMAAAAPPPAMTAKRNEESGDLSWDDDELETQIYDDEVEGGKKKTSKPLPLGAPPTPQPAMAAGTQPPPGPDLSSLVSTAKGWEASAAVASARAHGSNGSNGKSGEHRNGSQKLPEQDPVQALAATLPSAGTVREISVPSRLVQNQEPLFDPMAQFGANVARRDPRNRFVLLVAIGGAAVAVIGVILVILLTGGPKKVEPAAPAQTAVAVPAGDQNTGFDLYVNPSGVTTWRLDGEERKDRLPSRIRGISPGTHQVAIDAPPGFMGQNQPVMVEVGKSPKIEIVLQPLDIAGKLESTPPGATVSLIIDGTRQTLGPSPQTTKLDPRKSYQVLFEKGGYVSVNRPIVFTGAVEEKIVVNLEKASAADTPVAPSPPPAPPTNAIATAPSPPRTQPSHTTTGAATHPSTVAEHTPDKTAPDKTPPEKSTPDKPPVPDKAAAPEKAAGGQGTLAVTSKPPCEIFVDGGDTGMQTPKKLPLSAGTHKVTLVNNEFSIKESFNVDIKADATHMEKKDYTEKMNK